VATLKFACEPVQEYLMIHENFRKRVPVEEQKGRLAMEGTKPVQRF
jgi:hypothetical protein